MLEDFSVGSDSQEDPESMGPPATQCFQHTVQGAQTLFLPLVSKEMLPEIWKVDNGITLCL